MAALEPAIIGAEGEEVGDAACKSSKDDESDDVEEEAAAEMAAARAARNAEGSLRREGEAVADGDAVGEGAPLGSAAGGVAGRRWALFWELVAKVLRAGEEAADAAAAKPALLNEDDDADLANPGGG